MPENVLSIVVTAGIFALTTAWIPLLDLAVVRFRRARSFAKIQTELREMGPRWLDHDAEDAA